MRNITITLFFMLLFVGLNAQTCGAGGITFSSQADIDNFPVNYPGCTQILGGVTVSGAGITNLNALAQITSIGGGLTIQNNFNLTTLSGLDALITIEGFVRIGNNTALSSLSGLDQVISIGGYLSIFDHPALTNLMGLSSLTSIGGFLQIGGNAALMNLTGLNAVTSVVGDIYIAETALTSLTGLNAITSVGGDLHINGNASLMNLSGLNALTSIGGSLKINGTALTSLSGLNALTSMGGNIQITNNASLSSLLGLNALTTVGGYPEYFQISNNASLTNLSGLNALTSIGWNLNIIDNASLTNLEGLNAVTFIGGQLNIYNNSALTSLMGLNAVTSIGAINILNNPVLTSLLALNAVTSIGQNGGWIKIDNNPSLTSLTGLNGITSIGGNIIGLGGGYVEITNNASLTSLSGLNSISSISGNGGYIQIVNNAALTSLSGLNALTSIGGNLNIIDNASLKNLTGFNALTYIGGYLQIIENPLLTNISGFNALTSIASGFSIVSNASLTKITGFNALAIAVSFNIINNPSLTSISGFESLSSVGGLDIHDNDFLTNLTGLEALTSIGAHIRIINNASLTSLIALSTVTSIGSDLQIMNNDALMSLSGLDNINSTTITNLTIQNSNLLSSCDVQSICEYLAIPSNPSTISGNATGCATRIEVEAACNAPTCPSGDIVFTTQAEIDAFPINYPGCTQISGNVIIDDGGSGNITNLNGLSSVAFIEGFLRIENNAALISLIGLNALTLVGLEFDIHNNNILTSLTGLNALTSCGGALIISTNNALTSLTGLNALTSCGSLYIDGNATLTSLTGLDAVASIVDLQIYNTAALTNLTGLGTLTSIPGLFQIYNNAALTSLTGLDALTSLGPLVINSNPALTTLTGLNGTTSINGWLTISNNAVLTSLTGLDNINPTTITDITIQNSNLLSLCEVQSICNYLAIPSNPATISGNATGCATRAQVQAACEGCTAVSIVTQPQSQNETVGSTATFKVSVNGTAPFLFFWYKNGIQIPGATSSSYTTPVLTISDNGNTYYCIITNCSSTFQAISNTVTLTVTNPCTAVSIATQPQNQSATVGSTATFSVSVNGTAPFAFSWYRNGVQIPGASSSSYTTPVLSILNNGNTYYCIITNCSSTYQVVSNTVTLTVTNPCTAVSIATQPQSQNASAGSTATFSVSVNGTAPFLYFWYKNGMQIPGAMSSSYTTPMLTISDNGNTYYCIITNCSSTYQAISNTVTLTVINPCTAVSIATQPQSQNVIVGSTATFSVSVNGTAPFLYFWYKNGIQIPGATSSSYTTPMLTISDNGNTYYCIITNCSSTYQVISNTVTLTVINPCTAVSIATQPQSQNVIVGSTATFSVSVNGTAPFLYFWYKNGVQISGATGSFYTTPMLTISDNGNTYYCIITNCSSTYQVESNTVTLTVTNPCTAISIATQPQSQNVSVGSTTTFSVSVNGTAPFLYFWYKNGIQIPGATSSSYTTPMLTISDNGNTYYCIITNCSSTFQAISNTVNLTVTNPCTAVSIATQPQSQNVSVGSTATFSVSVNGTAPFLYFWYKNGIQIPGATSSSYTTPMLTISDNGNTYQCITTNCNSNSQETSNTVSLTVTNPHTCLSGGITFTSQAQIDAFPSNYPGCTQVLGNVMINDSIAGNITNLNGLAQITFIGGNFQIKDNSALTSLMGLDALASISGYYSGSLTIINNAALTSLTGLNSLTTITDNFLGTPVPGFIRINNNPALTSLSGLSALTTLNSLEISNNDALTNVSGLSALTSVNNLEISNNDALTSLNGLNAFPSFVSLNIVSNHALTSLNGLNTLTSIVGVISISNNSALMNLTGLNALTSVGEELQIDHNSSLSSLSGLNALTSISGLEGHLYIGYNNALTSLAELSALTQIGGVAAGGTLEIVNNSSLTSLTGLDNINPTAIINLTLQNSNMLSTCDVQSICNYLAVPSNSATISGNATGCANRIQVEATCAGCDATAIVTQPQNQNVPEGSTVTFSISVTGTPPFTYSWYKNGVQITGALNSSYTIPSVTNSDNGNTYYCIVSNCDGIFQVTSNTATLTIANSCTAISITAQPQNQSTTISSTATFTVVASGSSPYTYQWKKNGVNISNATSASYTTPTLALSDHGSTYSCYLTNCSGLYSIISHNAVLTVNTGCATPTTQASNISFSSIGTSQITIDWINGSGSRRLVKMNTENIFTTPTNGSDPIANTTYSGSGEQVVYNNSGSSVLVTGLLPNTTYWFRVYEANCTGSTALYYPSIATNNPNSQITEASGPTVNSITFTNNIENHSSITPLFTLYSGSPYVLIAPIKICADGSTATYFKVNVSNTNNVGFILLNELGQPITDEAKYGKIGVPYTFGNNVEVEYTHPLYMDADATFRSMTLQVTYNGIPISGINFPLAIYRAPIVFVHGLWGNNTTFTEMKDFFLNSSLYPRYSNLNNNDSPLLHRLDYQQTNASRYWTNRYVVKNAIDSILNKARQQNFSGGKVILIGHSMGGVLSRLYLQSTYENAFYRNDIIKIITINTPHYGTQIANWLSIVPNNLIPPSLNLLFNNYSGDYAAIDDLRVDSHATMHDLNIPTNSQNHVASTTIHTNESGDNSALAIVVRTLLGLAIYDTQNIYQSEGNDLIVPSSSQSCNLNLTGAYYSQWHMGSSANFSIISKIAYLLDENPNSSIYFTNNGFPNGTLTPPITPFITNNNYSRSLADSINIISPISGQHFNAGDSVTVNIFTSGNITKIGLIIYGNSISPISIDTTNVQTLKFLLPQTAVGTLHLWLLGGDSSGWYMADTTHIIVNSIIVPDSLLTIPSSIHLPIGLSHSVSVFGYFNGIAVNLIESPELFMTFDTNVLNYISSGIFQGITLGATNVIFQYQGLEDTIHIEVYNDPNILTASFNYSSNEVCENSSVQFTDASIGIPISYFWRFPGGTPSTSTQTNPVISYSMPGFYAVSITTYFTNGIDSITIDSLIHVSSLPTSTIIPSGATTFCQGDSVMLTSNSANSYLWSNGQTTQSIITSTAGSYFVTVTDINGCEGTNEITVNVNLLSSPTIAGNTTICAGDLTMLDAGSGYTNYLWSTTETSQTISASEAGDYTVVVIDSNSCSQSASVNITVNTVDVSVAQNGDTLIANATAASYQWIYCDSIQISGEVNQIFVSTQNNSYAVLVTQNGCIDTSDCFLINYVGTSTIRNLGNILIYPNPTNDLLNIKINDLSNVNYIIVLTNTVGQILNEKELNTINDSIETQLDMKNLSEGTYFLTISSDKIRQTFKVLKQ